MTHRQARRKLGSRSTRRSNIESVRTKAGTFRKPSKPRVAVAVRRLLIQAAQKGRS